MHETEPSPRLLLGAQGKWEYRTARFWPLVSMGGLGCPPVAQVTHCHVAQALDTRSSPFRASGGWCSQVDVLQAQKLGA